MKKYFLLSAMVLVGVAVLSQNASAQWTNPYQNYRMNDLIRRTPKKKVVKNNSVRSNKLRRLSSKKKVIRRISKKRRIASVEKIIFPKVYYIALSERNYTI